MQSQIDFTEAPAKVIRGNASQRYTLFFSALRAELSLTEWRQVNMKDLAAEHGISTSTSHVLQRLGAIKKRRAKMNQYEYKMLPLLVRLKPDDFLARRRAMVEPATPEQQESLLAESWFRWFAGGLIVGGVLVGLIVKLLM